MRSALLKRISDVIGAAVLLVVLAPLMLATALAVRFAMGRPVLFRQVRAGHLARRFTLFKFRTMREARGPGGRPLPDAERLTPLGRFLRSTSLDELPQLFNVLRGDMSLVGPRPLFTQYVGRYTPEQARRLEVKPGLTGWAQVNGRNALSWEEKFALDAWYVDHRSLRVDAKILLLTIWSSLRRDGISHGAAATMPEFLGTTLEVAGRTPAGSLAMDAVPPLLPRPFPPWPVFDEEMIDAASAVLRSGKVNYWTGQEARSFEREFAEFCGSRHAVALANGTVALELALAAVGVGPGDEVVVTCRSFVASASCCVVRGARPVFADVDPVSQNVTAESIRPCLTPRTKAVIAVHLAGWPCDMDPILRLARERGLLVIEDCAQAHGATYKGRPVGSLGHAAAFSFCQDKIITTGGEGGMLTTSDRSLWERAWSFKDHGKCWSAVERSKPGGAFQWLHRSIGTNGRMTEMQAAIGRVMLRRLPEWLRVRRQHAAMLHAELAGLPGLRVAVPPPHVEHSYYKYYAFVEPEQLRPGWSRDRIVEALRDQGIPCGSGICPEIYLEAAFNDLDCRPTRRLPIAKRLGETSMMFLMHPTLTEHEIRDTCRAVRKVLHAAAVAEAAPARHVA
jgi:dTDP-4-amino-4,6-dideoxygalactose transaminase/lipopolysaccharide/colanic/teichoic acid biosynthesis glycosyltransferase